VLAGNGTTQLIYLVARVLLPRDPLVIVPTFSEIANALIAASTRPRAIALDAESGFRFDRDAISRGLEQGADAIFIGRPNSPTGTILSYEDALAVAREASRRRAWCVFDEAFLDFVSNGRSIVDIVANNPRVMVLRSLTKIFAIPGLRLGCVISHPDTVRMLRDVLEPWPVNIAAEQVGLACLENAPEFVRSTQKFIAEERARLIAQLAAHPRIHCFDSVANFMMIKIRDESAASDFARHLMTHRIAIRDLRTLPGAGPGYYRIGLRNRADNDLLIDAILKWPA
jgi:threonine-phosphate decarboxylase